MNTLNNNRLQLNEVILEAPLPEWQLESIFGDDVPTVASLSDKPLLIMFFNLGCPGCLGRAVPYANRIVYEQGDVIRVIGIHSGYSSRKFDLTKFQKAKEEFYIRFLFYSDVNYDTTFLRYGAGGTPHWILVDKEGIVRYSIFGSDPNNALLRLEYVMREILLEKG
ncbi:MAG TPA: redoxin domain-containing protein [Saprospiraceae bacterium]|nr:redoxin domain-containing protein [Saprospiraceae bacterium]HRO08147.1 redoxin domain-containing protein [Saprospiraceae bacterium]HRO73844.1 redoxin domain-containing protein [Saprospiraceae bacterium]HRP41540.1 redoxin domain-containing protein [Saprospiraceae bacterium]